MEHMELTDAELAQGLRLCVERAVYDETSCMQCPMRKVKSEQSCFDKLNLMAADRLEALAEENRKLLDATDGICQRQMDEMVRIAGEMNTAEERGLIKVNQELMEKLMECQAVLGEPGRESVIRVKPMPDGGDRVLGIRVSSNVIFGGMDEDGEAGG